MGRPSGSEISALELKDKGRSPRPPAKQSNVPVWPYGSAWGNQQQEVCRGPTWGVKFTSGLYPWVGWWEIWPRSENLLSNLKTSRQRESKLGLQTADNGIRYDHTKLAHRFQTKTISHTFLDLFWRVYPLYQPVRVEENTKSFVIWDNIKTLAIYVLILGYWDGI